MPLSSSQFGSDDSLAPAKPDIEAPLSLSSSTTGSAAQATAWRNRSIGKGPLSLSAKTRGTVFNWDDTSSAPSIPQSDKGAGRN